jgi:hypothetical protein
VHFCSASGGCSTITGETSRISLEVFAKAVGTATGASMASGSGIGAASGAASGMVAVGVGCSIFGMEGDGGAAQLTLTSFSAS